MNKITTTPIITPISLKCPHCGEPVLTATKNDISVPGGGYWLHDGDTLSKFYRKLTAEQKLSDNSSQCYWNVGSRPCCDDAYYVHTSYLSSRELSDDQVEGYFRDNTPTTQPTNYTVADGKDEWLLSRRVTPDGIIVDEHTFGPFAPGAGVDGDDLNYAKWDAMRELVSRDI
jgi:hypothetical protein